MYNYEYLCQPTQKIYYGEATISDHSFARDSLIEDMKGDWILMLDTDISFEPDIAARMLSKMEKHNIEVLIGLYPYKGNTPAPVAYGYNKKERRRFVIGDWDKTKDIIEIHSAGAGCLMIRKTAVDKIKKDLKTSLFAHLGAYSEDNSFFERLHKVGIKAYFSPTIMVEHLVYRKISLEKDYHPSEYQLKKEPNVEGRILKG
jgi:GT2 family glycosyltransferase